MTIDVSGWVKIHRKFEEWEWYTDSKAVHLFVHCILKANRKPRKWRGIKINPGQFITSLSNLKLQTGISVQSLRTTLKKLEETGEVTRESTQHYTLITVCNWETYQTLAGEANTQTNTRLTHDQHTPNNKQEVKEGKEYKEERVREGLPAAFRDFINVKTLGQFNNQLQHWRAVWNQLSSGDGEVTPIIAWALTDYHGAIASPKFFVTDTWPKIIAAYNQRNGKANVNSRAKDPHNRPSDEDWAKIKAELNKI